MAGQVAGKVALVTGGASGIGAAVAELLAQEGASVVVSDVDELKGPEVVAGIRRAGREAMFLHHDVTSEARWAEVVSELERRYGRLHILVSNAGIGIAVPSIVEMSLEDWRRQTAINLDGVFLSVKHCLPLMRKSGGGSIIMMSSLAGLRGGATLAGYCATKGGVRLFAKAIAMECASIGAFAPVAPAGIFPQIGVSIIPGWTELTLMPSPAEAHSIAIALANNRTPPLVAQ